MLANFILVLAIQTLFLARFFIPFYNYSMLKDIQKEFYRLTKEFHSAGEDNVNADLRDYAIQYQAPVLVFTEDYRFLDRYFFDQLSLLTLRDDDSRMYKLPVDDMINLDAAYVFEKLYVEAERLGNSGYYNPSLIRSDKKTYFVLYTPVDAMNRKDEKTIINPVRSWYLQQGGGSMKYRARLIYNEIKDCFIERTDIDAYLSEMTGDPFTDNTDTVYYFISHSRRVNGLMTYFVTIRPIILTGSEARYFSKYFYILLSFLFLIFIIVAYILSRRLSSPILKLSSVTERLANRDFSVRSAIRSRNEIGRLSGNINLLADNLEKTITDLQQATETSRFNETRMKRLLADLAHEFKTPLGIISLYFEVIEKGLFEKEPAHYFRILEHEIENLTQMIDDTIQFTKMQAGYLECRPGPVELTDLIETALARFTEKLERDNFTLDVQSPDVTVMADGRRIEQVFTNLISNAINYSSDVKHLEVKAIREDQSVIIKVSNYGDVSEEDLNRIWERYYRAAQDGSVRLPSQGIGLEIVKGILTMHDSNFGVKHEADKITFFFSLPRADEM